MTQKPNKNCQVGDRVEIIFEDHSEGDQHIEFSVFGRVLRKDRKTIVLGSFVYHPEFKEVDDNVVQFTIVRKAIKQIEILAPIPPQTQVFVANV